MSEITDVSTPEVEQSIVKLTSGVRTDGALESLEISREIILVHMADPKGGVFSQKKKQCDLWEFVWGTSMLLASFISMVDLDGANVLELGGGSGLCSLSAIMSKAKNVTMTDLVQDAVEMWRRSADANGLGTSGYTCRSLDWNKEADVEQAAYDLVIASDVLFYRGTVAPVAHAFAKSLKPGGIGILADPCRCNTDDFESKLDDLGIKTVTYLFLPELISFAQNLEKNAFVDVKKVKLLVFRKPHDDQLDPSLEKLNARIESVLPTFVKLDLEG